MTVHPGSMDLAANPRGAAPIRPFYWSLARELWENRFVWIIPISVAALVLLGTLLTSIITLARLTRSSVDAVPRSMSAAFSISPAPIMLCSLVVGLFYVLDAMHGERRDRSILFWKSLPIPDRTTVFAKLTIPIVVLPALGLLLSILTLTTLLLANLLLAAVSGIPVAVVWRDAQFVESLPIMAYGLFAHAFWYAPLYAWGLLVSAWCRRAPALWFFLPPLAIVAVERVVTGTSHVASFISYRLSGVMTLAFDDSPQSQRGHIDRLAQLEPAAFLSSPGLWLGLLFVLAAAAIAVQLRRRRTPH